MSGPRDEEAAVVYCVWEYWRWDAETKPDLAFVGSTMNSALAYIRDNYSSEDQQDLEIHEVRVDRQLIGDSVRNSENLYFQRPAAPKD